MMLKQTLTGIAALSALTAAGEFTLSPLFSDHAVVQRDISVPVWGTAGPGDRIRCRLGKSEADGTTEKDGSFLLRLPSQKAGGPYVLKVENRTTGKILTANDVYVGEVWLASGQSNMEFTLRMLGLKNAIQKADDPLLRIRNAAQTRNNPGSGWMPVSRETAPGMSGTAYFFGLNLRKQLKVPVGIINNAVGGSAAEAWISREALVNLPFYRKAYLEYEAVRNTREWQDATAAHDALARKCLAASRDNLGAKAGWQMEKTARAGWKEVSLPSVWGKLGYDFNGTLWFRKEVNLPADWKGQNLTLSLGCVDKQDITYFNGVEVGRMGKDFEHGNYCVPRFYTIPGRLVKAGKNTIAVRANSFVFDGGLTGPAEKMELICGNKKLPLAGKWLCRVEQNLGKVKGNIEIPRGCNDFCVLFDELTRPVIPYAIRGIIWYQGCSNAFGPMTPPTAPLAQKLIGRSPAAYAELMEALIQDWRRRWGQGMDLPFLQVQLAGWGARGAVQAHNAFASIRDAQYISSRKTGNLIATAYDIGEAKNIHPKNKPEVGRRLALAALKQAYGRKLEAVGPELETITFENGVLVLSFRNASGLHCKGSKCQGFALSYDGGSWLVSDAVLKDGKVEIRCKDGRKPKAVRFAWAGCPIADLYNGADLPAYPFSAEVR